jgi:hypothetical protein
MLRNAWNKAVYQYQTLLQTFDRDSLEAVDGSLKEAREGKQIIYTYGAPMSGYASVHVIQLSPEAQQKVIAECEKRRAEIVETMDKRREKYGLKP